MSRTDVNTETWLSEEHWAHAVRALSLTEKQTDDLTDEQVLDRLLATLTNVRGELSMARGDLRSARQARGRLRITLGSLRAAEGEQNRDAFNGLHQDVRAALSGSVEVGYEAKEAIARRISTRLAALHYVRLCVCTDQYEFDRDCPVHGDAF